MEFKAIFLSGTISYQIPVQVDVLEKEFDVSKNDMRSNGRPIRIHNLVNEELYAKYTPYDTVHFRAP
ncbi:hypothetical protein ACE6H2_013190 [Prunus campanulata]